MEPLRGPSDVAGVPRLPSERRPPNGRRPGRQFEAELDHQEGADAEPEATGERPPRRLQAGTDPIRRDPSDGERHIDVLA